MPNYDGTEQNANALVNIKFFLHLQLMVGLTTKWLFLALPTTVIGSGYFLPLVGDNLYDATILLEEAEL